MSENVIDIKKPARLYSLDVFRGITIAGMLLVNNAGDWGHIFKPLGHAAWHGITATDLIFPFFLFIMGVAMTYSFSGRLSKGGGKKELYIQVIRRTLILTILSQILSILIMYSYLGHYRFYGVLQRIAFCYFFTSLIILNGSVRAQVVWTFATLSIYYFILKVIPAPDMVAGALAQYYNIVDYIDTKIMLNFLYEIDAKAGVGHDPEGLLSTISAISTTLTGVLCGHWLKNKEKSDFEKISGMAIIGTLLLIISNLLVYDMPFNKNLWTPSYVIHTTAWALLCLGVCYYLCDVKNYKTWAKPFLYYGTNPITAYFGASAVAIITVMIKMTGPDGKTIRLKTYLYNTLIKSWVSPLWGDYVSSAAWGMLYVIVWCFIMWILFRKKIFIKI